MEEDKPLLADGSIVGDYRPLLAYWRKAKEKDRRLAEKAILEARDFERLDRLVSGSGGRISVAEAREKLRTYFAERIDPRIAAEAVREAYGVEEGLDEARSLIADIMAGWLIEAAKSLKRYKVGSSKPSMQS